MLGQSGFMICLGCFKSHHNGLFSVGHGQTATILGGDGHQSLLYFKSPSRVASVYYFRDEILLGQISKFILGKNVFKRESCFRKAIEKSLHLVC